MINGIPCKTIHTSRHIEEKYVHIRGGLDRLHAAKRVCLGEHRAGLGQLHVDHVPELALGKVRNADGGNLGKM
jgi:hypothetical protein